MQCCARYYLQDSIWYLQDIFKKYLDTGEGTFGRYFSQDTFHPKNLVNHFKHFKSILHNSNLFALSEPLLPAINETALKMICNDFLVVKVNCPSYVFNISKSI